MGYRGKTSKVSMGSYQRTEEETDASIWCLRNDICITPSVSTKMTVEYQVFS